MSQSELFDGTDDTNSHAGAEPSDDTPQTEVERWAARSGHRWILGVDEAGRGPLAGPVYVGCVAVDLHNPPGWAHQVADSKQLTADQRDLAFDDIRHATAAFSIQSGSPDLIDTHNILQATRRTMARAIEAVVTSLTSPPDAVYIDGNDTVPVSHPQHAVVDGDARSYAIAAASILAKVARDRFMIEQHAHFPEYGFDGHKGYPTPEHLESLRHHGPSPLHRHSFAPVRDAADHT
jgi:ribonuclease HII